MLREGELLSVVDAGEIVTEIYVGQPLFTHTACCEPVDEHDNDTQGVEG